MPTKKTQPPQVQQTAIGSGNIQIVGDNNQVVIYQGMEIVIPSAEAVSHHRVMLKTKLEEATKARWGAYYIQEEGATLPIEASPYQTGQLGVRTNLQDSLKFAKRMLLLGDPGSGKTVALEHLAWELCKGEEPVIPVLIKLFKYDGKPLAEWVRARLQEYGCLRLDDENTLTVFLQEGSARCVFLFDGLNEVAPEYRNPLMGELDRWMSAYPRHAVIITSRVQDELWRKLREDIPVRVVQPIHNEQARTYLIAHLNEKGDELYRRLDERLLGLARTPLVLWLIKEAGEVGESLPGNRGELYQRFVERMLRRDKDREMDVQFSERMKERALSTLAVHISHMQRLTCSRREAVDVVASIFEEDVPGKLDKAEALVKACARHGLLAGEDELWFAPHQTVQEHFAAVALQDTVLQEQSLSGVARLVRSAQKMLTHRKNGLNALASEDWWMETLVQLAGIIEDPNWLVRTIAQTNPWLAWWCVQEGKIVDETTRAWIEERSSKLLKSPRVANRRRAVQTLVQSRNERVVHPLLQAVMDEDEEVSRLALQGLVDMGDVIHPLVEDVLHGENELLWLAALRFLRIFPDDYIWAEIPEQLWDKVLTASDRKLAAKAMSLNKTKPVTLALLKATADEDSDTSMLALQALNEKESMAWTRIVERVQGDDNLLAEIRQRLQNQFKINAQMMRGNKKWMLSLLTAMNFLTSIEIGNMTSQQFWNLPYGEPDWVTIPEGEFWMGNNNGDDNEMPMHKVFLPEYKISRVPITNAQYAIYVKESKADPPHQLHWSDGQIDMGFENHPFRNITWDEASVYCKWLSEKIEKKITLPSETEWEKAARGYNDLRKYPWGEWAEYHANTKELGLEDTTPVGLFLNGASPYGLLDMSGNYQELTRSINKNYPYNSKDGREELQPIAYPILRGGAYSFSKDRASCTSRLLLWGGCFRVVISPNPSIMTTNKG